MGESLVIVFVLAYFFAGLIKGTLGIGFPTAAIAFSATVVDARTAIATVVIPMCLINAWQVFRSGHIVEVIKENWRLVVTMSIAIAYFSIHSVSVPIRWLTLVLGIVTVAFSILSLWRTPPALDKKHQHVAQVVTGGVAGFMGGLAGIWAPPIIMYLSARRVSSDVFVRTVGVVLFVGSAVLLLGYIKNGMVNQDNAVYSSLLLLPAIAGFTVGEMLRTRITREVFYRLVLILFLLLGLNFIRRAIFFV